jgi:hypothetical protein
LVKNLRVGSAPTIRINDKAYELMIQKVDKSPVRPVGEPHGVTTVAKRPNCKTVHLKLKTALLQLNQLVLLLKTYHLEYRLWLGRNNLNPLIAGETRTYYLISGCELVITAAGEIL